MGYRVQGTGYRVRGAALGLLTATAGVARPRAVCSIET